MSKLIGITGRHIWRAVIATLAMASLAVSAVAGCTCSHPEAVHEAASCHAGSGHASEDIHGGDLALHESCVCVQPASERSVKSESFKLKKQTPAVVTGQLVVEPIQRPAELRKRTIRRAVSYRKLLQTSIPSRGPPAI